MIVGTVLFNIFIKLKITNADLLGNDYLAIYDSVRINGITVWKYVLKSRMKWLVFLVLAGITKIRIRFMHYLQWRPEPEAEYL